MLQPLNHKLRHLFTDVRQRVVITILERYIYPKLLDFIPTT